MVNREDLAKTIIDLRNKKKYSQRKLALVSGVSNSTISRIENAGSDTDPETLKKLAPFLDVNYEELMKAAGYLKEYSNIGEETLEDEDFNRILPVILKYLNDNIILKHNNNESEELLDSLDIVKAWDYLSDDEKITLFNLVIKEARYNKTTNRFSLTQYFAPNEEGYKIIRNDFLEYIGEKAIDINSLETLKKSKEDKYKDVDDVEEAMKVILEQPGLMLKGTILSDESKIILANAIQMGLRTAEELEKKKNEGDSHE